jgi:hypothetical protein
VQVVGDERAPGLGGRILAGAGHAAGDGGF